MTILKSAICNNLIQQVNTEISRIIAITTDDKAIHSINNLVPFVRFFIPIPYFFSTSFLTIFFLHWRARGISEMYFHTLILKNSGLTTRSFESTILWLWGHKGQTLSYHAHDYYYFFYTVWFCYTMWYFVKSSKGHS